MKVNTTSVQHPIAGAPSSSRAEGSGAPGAATSSGATQGKGAVDLSSAARHLSNLQDGGNDINIERVDALRAAIVSGQLKINPDHIADEVLASARELLK